MREEQLHREPQGFPGGYMGTLREVVGQTASTCSPDNPITPEEHLTRVVETVDWEGQGARILQEAYARWEDYPPLRLKIGRIEAYMNIIALQAMCTHPDVLPFMADIWKTMGHQLADLVADTPEIAALIETGWHREHDAPRDHQETEEQPTAADATARPDMVNIVTRDSGGIPPQPRPEVDIIDVTRPYCYRIDQTDRPEHRPDEDFMLSWGSCKKTPHPAIRNALEVAVYQAAVSRIEHNYLGPLRVAVWQQGHDEHFRQEPPADAFVLDVGERHDDLTQARKLIASVERDE